MAYCTTEMNGKENEGKPTLICHKGNSDRWMVRRFTEGVGVECKCCGEFFTLEDVNRYMLNVT